MRVTMRVAARVGLRLVARVGARPGLRIGARNWVRIVVRVEVSAEVRAGARVTLGCAYRHDACIQPVQLKQHNKMRYNESHLWLAGWLAGWLASVTVGAHSTCLVNEHIMYVVICSTIDYISCRVLLS